MKKYIWCTTITCLIISIFILIDYMIKYVSSIDYKVSYEVNSYYIESNYLILVAVLIVLTIISDIIVAIWYKHLH